MIYNNKSVTFLQKYNFKFTAITRDYGFGSLTKTIDTIDTSFKPIGPTMLVEWSKE